MKLRYLPMMLALAAAEVVAGSSSMDAAIGGGIGGATGAVIGNEVGGRDGAIVGGALGAAVGAAVATDRDGHRSQPVSHRYREDVHYHYYEPSGHSRFCPPGQAKKGRC